MKKKGSKKLVYPDWSKTAGQIIANADENVMDPRPVWRPYDWDSADDTKVLHSLCVTLEISGALYPFGEEFNSDEEREAFMRERNREATWLRALGFAEQMWRDAPHREYVVLFQPVSQENGRETVCIYQLLHVPRV